MKNLESRFSKIIPVVTSPVSIGVVITLLFTWFAYAFYIRQNTLVKSSDASIVTKIVETIDQKTLDTRFLLRGQETTEEKVAVLAIDDESLTKVGRWPWSRETLAHLIDQLMSHGAKSLGFDMVFSEPQIDNTYKVLSEIQQNAKLPGDVAEKFEKAKETAQPDKVLAQVIEKYADKLILGAFFEENLRNLYPYQTYCYDAIAKRLESFQTFDSQTLPPFIFNDLLKSDPLGVVPFSDYFEPIFKKIDDKTTAELLKNNFKKTNVSELTPQEAITLGLIKPERTIDYCQTWLTPKDSEIEYWKKSWNDMFKDSPELVGNFEDKVKLLMGVSYVNPIVQLGSLTTNIKELRDKSAHTASFNAVQDSDGSIRRASLLFRSGQQFLPSLSLQTYLVASGYQAHFTFNIDPDNPQQLKVTELAIKDGETDSVIFKIPVDNQGRTLINFAGREKSYPHVPASELFNDNPTMKIYKTERDPVTGGSTTKTLNVNKAEWIKDRIFIIGATAIGVYDLRVTPFQENFPGVETHVNVIGNILSKNFLRIHPLEFRVMMGVLLALGILLSLVLNHLSALPGMLITLAISGGIFAFDRFVLFKNGIIATTAFPMVLVVLIYVLMTFYKYLTEERKKAHLKATFSKYVSPAIVEEILADPQNVNLGGRKQRMSVFFSDIRGFTTISEKLDPQVLSDVLNRYLTPATEIVFSNKGTLDKYMGDAVMAFFGAPIFYEDHAKCACRCALQTLENLKQIQIAFAKEGLPSLDIGIGINTAEMSVGNMGSDIVRSYTVMGDAVNLGSRLEGTNKEYGTRIIISEFTYGDVKNDFTCRELDWVKVKGKNQPIKIFELICEGSAAQQKQDLLKQYNEGYRLYHERNFQAALDCFKKALEIDSTDPVSELYVERCQDFMAEPPPENWDGVFVMKTK